MGPVFSMSSLMSLTDTLGLSPYFVLDPKSAFLISRLDKGSVYIHGTGALAAVAAMARTGRGFFQDGKKLDDYIKEYLPFNPLHEDEEYEQILSFGHNKIDPSLWKKLKKGGFYILGAQEKLDLTGFQFEAFGKLWPVGEATEFGWRFDSEESGLTKFETAKLKKLS